MFEPSQSWAKKLLDFSLQILELVKPCREMLTKECLYFMLITKLNVDLSIMKMSSGLLQCTVESILKTKSGN